jgi:hypothetical protein
MALGDVTNTRRDLPPRYRRCAVDEEVHGLENEAPAKALDAPKFVEEPCKVYSDPAPRAPSPWVAHHKILSACASDLQELWMRSADEHSEGMQCALQKFSRVGHPRLATALMTPPRTPPPELGEEWAQHGGQFASALHTELQRYAVAPTGAMDMELWVDASLQDSALEALHAMAQQSARHAPRSGEAVCAAIGEQEREQIVSWLLQVGLACGLLDEAVLAAVQMLDRYCAQLEGPVPPDSLHLVVTAILSLALKVAGPTEEFNKVRRHRELLADLGRGQFTVEEVFATETKVLRALSYNISVPTSLDFAQAFLVPFSTPGQPEVQSPVTCLAKFLLQLSLSDPALQYRYPHAILAAGAVYVALWCTKAQPARVAGLLGDLGAAMGRTA